MCFTSLLGQALKDELKSLTALKYFKVAADIFTPGIERSPVESSRTIIFSCWASAFNIN